MYIQNDMLEADGKSSQNRLPMMQEAARRQAGFSLVEISIVMAIVLLLSIIAIPTVKTYVIESKVPKVLPILPSR